MYNSLFDFTTLQMCIDRKVIFFQSECGVSRCFLDVFWNVLGVPLPSSSSSTSLHEMVQFFFYFIKKYYAFDKNIWNAKCGRRLLIDRREVMNKCTTSLNVPQLNRKMHFIYFFSREFLLGFVSFFDYVINYKDRNSKLYLINRFCISFFNGTHTQQ